MKKDAVSNEVDVPKEQLISLKAQITALSETWGTYQSKVL
jgi:hypothetical protein